MKIKKIEVALFIITMTSLLLLMPANASTFPNLPPNPVNLTVNGEIILGQKWPRYVDLSDVPIGYDVWNSPPRYTGWCVELLNWIDPGTTYPATLTAMPPSSTGITGETWNKINYLLNFNTGKDIDLQMAIWYLLGYTVSEMASHGYTFSMDAQNMVNDANTNGGSFVPSAGQIMAIYCEITAYYRDTSEDAQDIMIELEVPPEGFQGLTPGFWKNHLDAWEDTGHSPEDSLDDVFDNDGTGVLLDQYTLLDALWFKGGRGVNGSERILLRAAVAAILNAAHPDINYPLTTAEIVDAVNEALQSNDRGTILGLAELLDSYNNLGL